jgi:cytochrome c553
MGTTHANGALAATAALLAALLAAEASADEKQGEAVYGRLCASCHGPKGEGTKKHPDPLIGTRPLEKLAAYIAKNMPEDAPGKCVGDDAKNVAEYIYNAFYSPAAQARNRPLRVELSRLTVGQYRTVVADLIGTFSEPAKPDDRRGLTAQFFNGGRRIQEDRRVHERLDPKVDFKFGAASPAEKVTVEQYAIRWSGSVLAPDSGEYEFVTESENGARLWVNDFDVPLIDAMVRSGDDKVRRGRLFLLGGRLYPLRLEFYKSKGDKTASIAFRWKRPQRAEELLTDRHVFPVRAPEALVVKTPFPPDDRSMGYERSSSISREWDEAATKAALEVASYVALRRDTLFARLPEGPHRIQDGCRRLAERAFRRPLSREAQAFFVDRHFEGSSDVESSIKKSVLLILKSPGFLYHEFDPAAADPHAVASRLAFALWDSLPDAPLIEAARAGKLGTREDIARQVGRMLDDPRARLKVREFYHRWLNLDRLHELSKDAKRFPEFSEAVVSDLWTSLDLFLDEVTWSDASDFRELLLADFVPLNGRLARVYGADLPPDAPFQKVTLDPEKHSGLLTHPLLMAGLAYDSTSSPIHRGLFIARSLLGKRLRPPPEAVTPLSPELHPDLTTRERITLQTRAEACQSCHAMVNPLGFALEHYDAVGRFRGEEKGKPIDASGTYSAPSGDEIRFKGARELGRFLAKSEETQEAFVEHLFHFLVKQPVRAYGSDRPETLRSAFAKSGLSIRALLVDVIATSAAPAARIIRKTP